MEFKKLNDLIRGDVIMRYLQVVNQIEGALITILVDKDVQIFADQKIEEPSSSSWIDVLNSRPGPELSYHPRTREKLMRIVHFFSLLMAGFSSPGQNVIWLTDEDEIAPNADRMWDLCALVAQVSGNLLNHNMGHFRCGTPRNDPGSLWIEDFVAIPDLASGAVAELFSRYHNENLGPLEFKSVTVPSPDGLSAKSRMLINWMTWESSLSKFIFVVERGKQPPDGQDTDGISVSTINLTGFA